MRKATISILCSYVLLAAAACSDHQEIPVAAPTPPKAISAASAPSSINGPESSRGEDWEYILNDALITADEYATEKNPSAVFVGPGVETSFVKQFGGEYEGRYLLVIVNRHGGNTSLASLLPLFDENSPSDSLDDSSKLWRVVLAKFNGREF